ncbi:MAG TPA: DHA2 family efflux MFS transporter permease subunit [Stellaceae bacterium]|nr:DHA2 family efflux MFS transporter permease subunit [Stellaceae bacterium]
MPLRQVLVPMIVACALFMENLDSTVIATALPKIAESLQEDPLRLNLAITSYLLSLAVFIPLSGWVADRYGARSVFRAAIVVFTVGSACCGISQSLPELVAARILQGIGGAMMVPVGRLVMLRTVPKSELVRAMSYLTVPALIGPVLGPPLGGFIVTYSSWRWIFYINLPIGLLGIVLATLFIENIKEIGDWPLDLRGFLLAAVGLAGLMFGFENAGRGVLPMPLVVAMLLGGAICITLYVLHSRLHAYPIIDLKLLRIPTLAAAITGGSLFRIGIGALPFLLPLMLQLGFGMSPFASGLLTFASAAGAMTMKMTAAPIIRSFGFRRVLLGNAVISSAFVMSYAWFSPETSHWLIFVALLAGGFFRSLQFTCTNTLIFADVPPPLMSRATSFQSMAQQLSVSVGVGIGALLLHVTLLLHGRTELSAGDFSGAFLTVALISLSSIFFYLPLAGEAGAEVSGHHAAAKGGAVPGRGATGD